ncbi:MAG: biotin--[acetyl-CoA-carboxylase] ligase [Faecalibacterium sp.]
MSINEVRFLPECTSTNAYAKAHFEEFGPVGAVYTTNQTAGRGRLGRSWANAEGRALYYTAVIREPLAQPSTLPLLASLAVRRQLAARYGVACQIKWPNDLLLNGKKVAGILCESVCYGHGGHGRGIICGIGINLAQSRQYFEAADLPHGTSLALEGAEVDLDADPAWLAEALTDFGFDRPLYVFAREGFAPFRQTYKDACINLGRNVVFDLPGGGQGSGKAIDIDEEGQLIVQTDGGEKKIFTGEVSVRGIYGAVAGE